jgi:hypothetical protein
MANQAYTEMITFFKEGNLAVPYLFERFAESLVNEPGMSRWRVGETPATWPFASPGETEGTALNTRGSFTNFISVSFTLYEPWDDIDDEYGDAVIDLRLVTRELLLDLRVSERRRVRRGGGNSLYSSPDSEWNLLWNEALRDLDSFAEKFDLFAKFDNFSESFTPESAICFDALQDRFVMHTKFHDGPPSLEKFLWQSHHE